MLILLMVLPAGYASGYQLMQSENDKLNVEDTGIEIENYISLHISESDYYNMRATSGQKIMVDAELLIINGDTLKPEIIETRGQTTLNFIRKSLSVKLESKASFKHGERSEKLKRFFLLSLSMDRYYTHNRLAFGMMEECRLFGLFYSFCELKINRKSEGIYMVVERPDDWALGKMNSPLVIRRGYNNRMEKIIAGKETDRTGIKKYSEYYKQIYNCLNKQRGEELYKNLSGLLDVNLYMKWMAFNFIIRNGDYTDEVYFYVDPVVNKFRIIPWDYDDLFAVTPHEGAGRSGKPDSYSLIFSTEDLLDKKIASDKYLYQVYLGELRTLLKELSTDVLKRVFQSTYSELCPFYSRSEIIGNTKSDLYKDANRERLKEDLSRMYEQLIISRDLYLNYLKAKTED